jgi:hypothetical protein
LRKLAHAQETPLEWSCLRAQEFLLRVELLLEVELPGGGFISQEVRPEDEMAADSQNGDIIVLSFPHFFFNNYEGRG